MDLVKKLCEQAGFWAREQTVREVLTEAAKEIKRLQEEIEGLREKRLQDLHQFLNEQRPKIDGSGWLTRDIVRRTILDFLVEFEAAEAAGREVVE